ncbi:MAG: TrmB family transcriptional regulator [Methanobacteriota archaeon]
MSEVRARANALLGEAEPASLAAIGGTLRELGLGGYAADAFCALTRVARATAGDLVRTTGIPDSKIYYALDELVERGLAEVQEGKPKSYRLVPPKEIEARLTRLLDARRARERDSVTRLVSLVEPLRSAARTPTTDLAYIVKGTPSVLARAESMVASARREIVLLASDVDVVRRLEAGLLKAIGRKVGVKLAIPDIDLPKELSRRAEIREIVCACVLLVVDGQQVLTVTRLPDGSSYGITSTDETLVRIGREYWESPRCCVT